MSITKNHVELIVLAFFASVVGLIFFQISTVLKPEGMASGDPFHNAAFYPKAVAIIMLICTVLRLVTLAFEIRSAQNLGAVSLPEIGNSIAVLAGLGAFVWLLAPLGYQILSAPFMAFVMFLCGERRLLPVIGFSIVFAFATALLFENVLKVVLPIGSYSIDLE